MSDQKPRGKTLEELKADYRRLKKQAEQDLRDFNSGRELPSIWKAIKSLFRK